MNEETKQHEAEGQGNQAAPTRTNLYAKVARHIPKAIDVLVALLDSRNEGIRMGAAKEIINKGLPDLKAMEVTGENGEPIRLIINAGNGFLPATLSVNASPAGSYPTGSTPIQGDGVAQESTKDNNSDNRVDKAEPTT